MNNNQLIAHKEALSKIQALETQLASTSSTSSTPVNTGISESGKFFKII